MKVNARLTGEAEKQFVYLLEHTNLTQSDIIKEGINQLYRKQLKVKTGPIEIFKKNFAPLNQGSGREDLSTNYKELLGDSLNEKYHR